MALNESVLDKRESYIVYLLGKNERITIAEFCEILNMAPSTMRKILTNMEKKGVIIRTHGGAVSIDSRQVESLERKGALNVAQKKSIATVARGFIQNGETIALGDGSTIVELCYQLHNLKNAIVLTDSIVAANVLMFYENIEVRICSGIVQKRTGNIVGMNADKFFQGIHVDKAFIGADSVSVDGGVGNSNILVSQVERSMIRCARERFVVCDYSKIQRGSLSQVVPISEINYLITDNAAVPEHLKEFEKQNITVIAARPL